MRAPILITGAARSGTSLTAAMIYYGGAFGGDMALPNKNKRMATLENTKIRNKLVKPYLKKLGVDPMGQKPLPNIDNIEIFDQLMKDSKTWELWVKEIIMEQGYSDLSQPWFYKGAKMCLLWPLWYAAFPTAKWIIVLRDRDQIIKSCLNTGFMSQYRDAEGWGEWVDYHLRRFKQMEEVGLDIQYTYPEKMIQGDFSEIKSIIEGLGLKWEQEKAEALINPNFWNKGGN